MKKIVLADYLFLHFKRDEWDREACYQSWGSSTEVFSWESLCDMTVDLPNISVQKKYVDDKMPTPPATGTYILKSINGVIQWVAE